MFKSHEGHEVSPAFHTDQLDVLPLIHEYFLFEQLAIGLTDIPNQYLVSELLTDKHARQQATAVCVNRLYIEESYLML